jgi:hypothetical protein
MWAFFNGKTSCVIVFSVNIIIAGSFVLSAIVSQGTVFAATKRQHVIDLI